MTKTKKLKLQKSKTQKSKTKKSKPIKIKKTEKLIYWTGSGSKNNGLHTPKEFLTIVQYQYPYWNIKCPPNKNIQTKNKKRKRFEICGKVMKSIEDWMKLTNAKWATT